jgi:hypothetical protein
MNPSNVSGHEVDAVPARLKREGRTVYATQRAVSLAPRQETSEAEAVAVAIGISIDPPKE